MATISALNLSQKLEQRQQRDQEAEQRRISELQQQHEKSLNELSKAALDTTSSVTASQRAALEAELKSLQTLTRQHSKQLAGSLKQLNTDLTTLSQQAKQRIKIMLLWPVLATVLLCLLMLASASAWSWYQIQASEKTLAAHQQKIQQMTAEFCSSPAGKKVCRPS